MRDTESVSRDGVVERIIAWSSRNKFLVLALSAAAVLGSLHALRRIPLDAIPDLSDTQVIIYSRWDRSPDLVEDQVTYPIVAALSGAPKVKAVRGFSDFGYSFVYVVFEDGTDLYWARSRTLEYLSKILSRLPEGVRTELGPDATGVGWVFQYALKDASGRLDLSQLRSLQDWFLRYQLQAVPGVAEVAAVGGFQKQYQIQLDPNALSSYGIPLRKVVEAVRDGNDDVGGRMLEFAGAEYMVRGRGYARSVSDIGSIVVSADRAGTPVLVRHLGTVSLGPDIRRGIADLDGEGDAVGAIVVMRSGENALAVIDRVKARLRELEPSLPPGVQVLTTYDRSDLIRRAISTLRSKLVEEMIIVSLIILLFLWHIPSAVIPIVTIPIAVLLSFLPMAWLGVSSNIMSLSGIAISIGVLVDGAIVEVENAYKKLQLWDAQGRPGDFHAVRLKALQEVGPSVFFSLAVVAVSFLPIFALVDQEGRFFKPLAFTKTLVIGIAAVLALTLDPALRMLFSRMDPYSFRPAWFCRLANAMLVGTYRPEEDHPVSRRLFAVYDPACRWVLQRPWHAIGLAAALLVATIPVYLRLGSEFMPPLHEGTILYMPTTLPGISVTEAQRLLQIQDRVLRSFPEVERVFGKAGRADSSTDPAPLSMFETTVVLKPEAQWREKKRWYSPLPGFLKAPLRRFADDRISYDELIAEMDERLRMPGVSNAWTMPIKARVDMLSTGVRTPVGVKVSGADTAVIESIGVKIERLLADVPGTRSAYAERTASGYYADFDLRRDALARYGLSVREVENVLLTAVGGEPVTTTVEGRERYTVSVRYAREFRDDLQKLRRVLVAAPSGAQVPLGELADVSLKQGPAMLRDENGMLTGYVYVDVAGRDVGGYVEEAKRRVQEGLSLPPGYALRWSGQYENMMRVRERLKLVLPLTLALIFLLIYMNTGSAVKTALVALAVPFSLIGAVAILWLLDYNVSIAVWVGMIALMGLDAETGVFMLLFLDMAYAEAAAAGRLRTRAELVEAIIHGAVKRVRPKMMTVCAAFMGLLPILWSMGTGADMMKRVAAPMVGGLVSSFLLELFVYPPLYLLWKGRGLPDE
ncbi:MAG: CusA/CzcA family heavy metal efflux RND transporter [Elusimicrobiota bacterium]|jgi:Cu(I)/Ag(I) efflux system membrane protein CusA/SilA